MAKSSTDVHSGKQISGRMVLAGILFFFMIVVAVNIVMAHYAISTFAGVETPSSYKAGLEFTAEREAAARQNNRHWQVEVDLETLSSGLREVTVNAKDAAGKPLTGLVAEGRLAHPTDARKDVRLDLEPLGNGRYRADVTANPGQWVLVIDFTKGDERMFRSRNRIYLPQADQAAAGASH
ncbi:FixH family protein [Xanthobacter sp. TB0139]|uniref:FixH family protein n=1 Tax=Xanthobacter sp. TB0139 TaxID=3459178 RepID=UPI00403A5F9F